MLGRIWNQLTRRSTDSTTVSEKAHSKASQTSSSIPTLGSHFANVRVSTKQIHDKSKSENNGAEPGDCVLPPPATVSFQPRKKARASTPARVHWAKLKRRLGPGTSPSTSSIIGASTAGTDYNNPIEIEHSSGCADAVIVGGPVDFPRQQKPGSGSERGQIDYSDGVGERTADAESVSAVTLPGEMLRWTGWPVVLNFFRTRFVDANEEQSYVKETWYLKKCLVLIACGYLILNMGLAAGTTPPPLNTFDMYFLYAAAPVVTIPLIFFAAMNCPRDRPTFYQVWLTFAVWIWPMYNVLSIYLCGFYLSDKSKSPISCGSKDFLPTFYYTSALQTIALFGAGLNRFPATLGALVFFVSASVMIIPSRAIWARSLSNFVLFQAFLLYIHYSREKAERHLYILRSQLKIQYKATQKAQISERKAADSKRNLTSYVFHDMFLLQKVRVPLNTALLAVQNIQAEGSAKPGQELEFTALEGSLGMMSQVLNDVLDFNRMDSGRFESVSRPYSFHHVMRSLFITLGLATDARGLILETHLDPAIDEAARTAAYEILGETPEAIAEHLRETPELEGVVIGDEIRLRQIITNLASNACKFTNAGGKLTITTKLISPKWPLKVDADDRSSISHSKTAVSVAEQDHSLSVKHLKQHNKALTDTIAVRIEVTDTGCGIKQEDIISSRLFSAFNQTELGRQQGGKGSGLGLALVRQIVKISGGRLGLRSKTGEGHGSTFWVELPLGVGAKAVANPTDSGSGHPTPDIEEISSEKNSTARAPEGNINMDRVAQNNDSRHQMQILDAKCLRIIHRESFRSANAMHGIMDQAGKVELTVSPSASEISLAPTPGNASSILNATTSSLSRPNHPTYVDIPQRPGFEANGRWSHSNTGLAVSTFSSMGTNSMSPSSFRLSPLQTPDSPTHAVDENIAPSLAPSLPSVSTVPKPKFEPPLNVLVVDDDKLTRVLMSRLLTRLGCHVTQAENGALALSAILSAKIPFDIVFLDNQMPVMSGVETIAKIRQHKRQDLVVGLTGNALLSDQEIYSNAGVDRVLTKPVLERQLLDMLQIADDRRFATPSSSHTP